MRVLLIEDDAELASGLASALAQSGYAADVMHTGALALAAARGAAYQLVILDLGLPDMDGVDVLAKLRRGGNMAPVLILTARDQLQERIRGLDAGGDDYLVKPFALGELEARMRALLRRGEPAAATLRVARLTFEAAARRFSVDGHEVELTAREHAVLELLLRAAGRIVGKTQIFESLYGWDDEANMSMIEVFVSRLRRKLDAQNAGVVIRAFRGLGYRLEAIQAAHEDA
jgi:DNA-binding response OmpR family regulator